jgi:serine/threonine-protein kinase
VSEAEAEVASLAGVTLGDKYKIVRQIGRGGMGVVYEAEHLGLGKRVAVKLMLEKYAADSDATSRFKREALAASRIGNPHIIDIADIGVAPDGRAYVVMELLTGSSLADVIKRGGALPMTRALDVIRQVLRAVGAAHAKGIIHRDLKPDNIFLLDGGDGRDFVKLLDFGIAKAVDQAAEIAKTNLTTTGTVMGTPLYMAPEQAMGHAADARVDLYALGVILYEMLAGAPPFTGVPYPVLLVKLLTEPPALLAEVAPGLPPYVVAAVHRALEKEPAERFASCDAFLAALDPERRETANRSAQLALDHTVAPGEVSAATMPSRPVSTGAPAIAVAAAAMTAPNTVSEPPRRRGALPVVLAAVGGAVVVGAIVIAMQVLQRPATPDVPPAIAVPAAATQPVATAPGAAAIADTPLTNVPPSSVPPTTTPPSAPLAPPATPPATTPPATPPPVKAAPKQAPPAAPKTVASAGHAATLDDVSAAIQRRDGKACLSALASLTSPPATDFRVASMHATCEMIAGNCDAGLQEQQALNAREGTPAESAKINVELYCPVTQTSDPSVQLTRMMRQMSMFSNFDCDAYIGPARALAKSVTADKDRHAVGVALAQIATCYSRRDKCDLARSVLGEAQVFIPALATNELAAACR